MAHGPGGGKIQGGDAGQTAQHIGDGLGQKDPVRAKAHRRQEQGQRGYNKSLAEQGKKMALLDRPSPTKTDWPINWKAMQKKVAK